jgi:uncharacterized delta-60 repeat protein
MRRLLIVPMCVVIVVGLFALPASADPGDRDPSFHGTGFNTASYGAPNEDGGRAIALVGTRKVVVLGNLDFQDGSLTRYKANGELDTGFSGDGKMTFDIGMDQERMGFAIGGDGKPVVAGRTESGPTRDFFVERFLKAGGIDTAFGGGDGDGIVTTDFVGGTDEPAAVFVQGNGKILVSGQADVGPQLRVALARYTAAGILDTTFGGGDGKVTTHADDLADGRAIAVQPNGKIVVVGLSGVEGDVDMLVLRYLPGGTLDPTFSGDGKLIIDFGGNSSSASSVALQPDGKIVVGGGAFLSGSNTNWAFARIMPDGTLDHSFSADGRQTLNFGTLNDFLVSVVVQPSGRIVGGGNTLQGSTFEAALARLGPAGGLDHTFGVNGKVIDALAGHGGAIEGLRTYGRERLVAAVTVEKPSGDRDAGAARYLAG